MEGSLVHRDGLAVELDRLLDRRGGERDGAELIGIADEENIGADAVAEQRIGGARGIDEVGLLATGIGDDRALEPLGRQREIGIAGKIAGQELGEVDHHRGRSMLDRGEHLLVAGHHHVAAEHEIGAARRDADGVDVLRTGGDAHVAVDRAALLRQPRHVEHPDALAFEMSRHPEDAADGDDPGAADAGDDDIVGLPERGQRRLRQRNLLLQGGQGG